MGALLRPLLRPMLERYGLYAGRTILFEHIPTDIDAPVIIEATIYDITQVGDARGNQMKLMNARVDRVIKGSRDQLIPRL